MTPRRWSLSLSLGLVALAAVLGGASAARADIGPIEPARKICMGSAEGSPCKIDGKAGTCQGPHPSRMYCTPGKEPATPERKPSPEAKKPVPPPDAAPAPTFDAAPPAPTPTPTPEPPPPSPVPTPIPPTPSAPVAPAAPPTKPTSSSGCAVGSAEASSTGLLLLLGAVLAVGRRRRATARR